MIYQFKVTLKDLSPPIWRRIQVESHFTFHDLHRILQIAFGWLDYHLHQFDVRKTNGLAPKSKIIIAPPSDDEDLFWFEHERLDEHEVTLEEIFHKEKDRCIYTYDFGDDWQHDIVLEKILSPEKGVTYPRCIKVMRRAPEEDSRWETIEFGVDQSGFDPVEEMLEINAVLEELDYEGEADDVILEDMVMEELWFDLYDIADEFYQLKPWRWIWDNQLFAVRHPETGEAAYCSVIGRSGESYGLIAFIGQEGLRHLERIFSDQIDAFNYLEMRAIALDFVEPEEVTEVDEALFHEFGIPTSKHTFWPVFRSYKPGYVPSLLDPDECEFMITILKQAIEVCLMAKEDDSFLNVDEVFYTRFKDEKGTWRGELQEHPVLYKEAPLRVDEIALQRMKRNFKPSSLAIEFDVFYNLTPVQENSRQRPYFPFISVALETEVGQVVFYELDEERDFVKVVQTHFLQCLDRLKEIPATVYVREEVYFAMMKIARKLKIELVVVEQLHYMEQFKVGLENFQSR